MLSAVTESFGVISEPKQMTVLLWKGILSNRDSKIARWVASYGVETTAEVFSNQAINTLSNWAARGLTGYLSVDFSESIP